MTFFKVFRPDFRNVEICPFVFSNHASFFAFIEFIYVQFKLLWIVNIYGTQILDHFINPNLTLIRKITLRVLVRGDNNRF